MTMLLNRNETDQKTAREILRRGASRNATVNDFLEALALFSDRPGYAEVVADPFTKAARSWLKSQHYGAV
jgi:hypothetical protein